MKTKASAAKKSKAKKVAAPTPGIIRRTRQSGVRERVLALLAAGPTTNAELLKNGKFTPSALYLHLKALRQQGIVQSKRVGRSVTLRLKTKAHKQVVEEPIDAVVVQEAPRPTSSALVPAHMSPELHEALNAVAFRLRPVTQVEQKLMVLDQLARSMPAAVSGVLHAVMEDLVKLSTLPVDGAE
jgi:DNA-binding transcriptional ArsR family regulator